jgi:ligand-binding sensor domain-containing protein
MVPKNNHSMRIFLITTIAHVLHFLGYGKSQDLVSKILARSRMEFTTCAENDRFTWVGTKHGLYQINKHNKKYCLLTRINSKLPDNYVTCIACKTDGQTYIGTKKGILFWNNQNFILINNHNSGLLENHIEAMTFDQEGCLWIRTRNLGIFQGIGTLLQVCKLN